MNAQQIVHLNVGGCVFSTYGSTLEGSNTFFSGLIGLFHMGTPDGPSASTPTPLEIFVDRDPTYFRHILNWLRGVRYLPNDDTVLSELSFEADYYCMVDMAEAIRGRQGKQLSIASSIFEIAKRMPA